MALVSKEVRPGLATFSRGVKEVKALVVTLLCGLQP